MGAIFDLNIYLILLKYIFTFMNKEFIASIDLEG